MSHLTDLLTQCIHCGFCLEDCPTFKITGDESQSPRGRIYLAKELESGQISAEDVNRSMETCLGCLACETACPSNVRYGEIIELTRERIHQAKPHLAAKAVVELTTHPITMKLSARLGPSRMPDVVSRALFGAETEANTPRIQALTSFPELTGDPKLRAYFLRGCAMDILFPNVHLASKRLLYRAGFKVESVDGGCCGSMHAHQGFLDDAKVRARHLMNTFRECLPVVVDSAGCGSTMKRYSEFFPGDGAVEQFCHRVFDLSEFLVNHGFMETLNQTPATRPVKVAYHDACHLAHGQKIKSAPRDLLRAVPGVELIEFEEADTCCGSAGVYNVLEPKMARSLLDRKMNNICAVQPDVIVLSNPGCHAWMAQGSKERKGPPVLHLAEFLENVLSFGSPVVDASGSPVSTVGKSQV